MSDAVAPPAGETLMQKMKREAKEQKERKRAANAAKTAAAAANVEAATAAKAAHNSDPEVIKRRELEARLASMERKRARLEKNIKNGLELAGKHANKEAQFKQEDKNLAHNLRVLEQANATGKAKAATREIRRKASTLRSKGYGAPKTRTRRRRST